MGDYPDPPRTFTSRTPAVIPVIDAGDHRTVGIMGCANDGRDLLAVLVMLMTPDEARQLATDLTIQADKTQEFR